MSYSEKNNIKQQLHLINELLPHYGINTLADTLSEITCNDIHEFELLSGYIPEIKKYFKTSIMNLGRSDNKFTKTNAIPILKHMCIQARIPFDITKYSNYYTFSLCEENILLREYRNKDKPIPPVNQEFSHIVLNSKPFEYFNNLSCYNVSELSLLTSCKNNTECVQIGGDITDDITPLLNLKSTNILLIEKIIEKPIPAISCISVLYDKISNWYEIDGKSFVSINIPRRVDILNRIINIKLYDRNGRCYYSNNTADVNMNIFYTINENVNDINIPIWCYPYQQFSLSIPYTDIIPYFYKVELQIKILDSKYFKMRCLEAINNMYYLPTSYVDPKYIKITTNMKYDIPNSRSIDDTALTISSSSKLYIEYINNKTSYNIDVENDMIFPTPPYQIIRIHS